MMWIMIVLTGLIAAELGFMIYLSGLISGKLDHLLLAVRKNPEERPKEQGRMAQYWKLMEYGAAERSDEFE